MKQRIVVPTGKKKEIAKQVGATYQTVRNALNGNSNSLLSITIRKAAMELGGIYESDVQ